MYRRGYGGYGGYGGPGQHQMRRVDPQASQAIIAQLKVRPKENVSHRRRPKACFFGCFRTILSMYVRELTVLPTRFISFSSAGMLNMRKDDYKLRDPQSILLLFDSLRVASQRSIMRYACRQHATIKA
jgi:hypothetical protein